MNFNENFQRLEETLGFWIKIISHSEEDDVMSQLGYILKALESVGQCSLFTNWLGDT